MSKINKYNDFLRVDEEFKISVDSLKDLMKKVKNILPKDKIASFIEENKEAVERVKNMITDEEGKIDNNKLINFVKNEVKKK
jgi:gas vesicle protein